MVIDWQKRENVFKLLAAVYAVLGEPIFKGRFGDIAERYGPDATYNAIKSEWKNVSKLAVKLGGHNERQTRPDRPIVPRSHQRRPINSVKAEPQDIICIDDEDDGEYAKSISRPEAPTIDVTSTQPNFRKRKRASETASLEPHSDAFACDARQKRLRFFRSRDVLDSQPQFRRPLQNDEPRLVVPMSLSKAEVIPSSVGVVTATHANGNDPVGEGRPSLGKHAFPCQVSSTEHNWHDLDSTPLLPLQMTPPAANAPQVTRVSPEAGPSSRKDNGHLDWDHQLRYAACVTLSDPDREDTTESHVAPTPVEFAGSGKGKAKMIDPPADISYADWTHGICYLCSLQFDTPMALAAHELGRTHLQELSNSASVEKGLARLERFGLVERSRAGSHQQFINAIDREMRNRPRTIIRGKERAVELGGGEVGMELEESQVDGEIEVGEVGSESSDDDVVEVTKAELPPHHIFNRASEQPEGSAKPCKIARPRKREMALSNAKLPVQTVQQMAHILRTHRFHRSGMVDQVLKALEHAGPPVHTTETSKSKATPNIWVMDAEFANLKKEMGLYALSVSIRNLLSDQMVVNHRLELPIPVQELEQMIQKSNCRQASDQFKIHYRRPCSLPIITPAQLSHLLKAAGFKPIDYIFVWHTGFVDYEILTDFLARDHLQQRDLMPPKENVIRVALAWRDLSLGVSFKLSSLFGLVFPKSPLNETHHFADVDTQKLGMMAWKLRDLRYWS